MPTSWSQTRRCSVRSSSNAGQSRTCSLNLSKVAVNGLVFSLADHSSKLIAFFCTPSTVCPHLSILSKRRAHYCAGDARVCRAGEAIGPCTGVLKLRTAGDSNQDSRYIIRLADSPTALDVDTEVQHEAMCKRQLNSEVFGVSSWAMNSALLTITEVSKTPCFPRCVVSVIVFQS